MGLVLKRSLCIYWRQQLVTVTFRIHDECICSVSQKAHVLVSVSPCRPATTHADWSCSWVGWDFLSWVTFRSSFSEGTGPRRWPDVPVRNRPGYDTRCPLSNPASGIRTQRSCSTLNIHNAKSNNITCFKAYWNFDNILCNSVWTYVNFWKWRI
jgi:hypothetical protein